MTIVVGEIVVVVVEVGVVASVVLVVVGFDIGFHDGSDNTLLDDLTQTYYSAVVVAIAVIVIEIVDIIKVYIFSKRPTK